MYDIGKAIAAAMVACGVVGFVVAALLFWFVPIVWAWIKPLLHAVTG